MLCGRREQVNSCAPFCVPLTRGLEEALRGGRRKSREAARKRKISAAKRAKPKGKATYGRPKAR